jgi:ABC-2 type transport system ATP-binding protein
VTVLAHGRVVAAGAMHEVRARVSQRRIRCLSTLDIDAVSTWPQVRHAQRDGERIDVIVENAEDVVRRLLAEDPGLRELEIQRAGLADAFLEITRDPESNQPALQEAA